jgi:hypothetical protein
MVRVWLAPTWAFFVLGIGVELGAVVFLVMFFYKRGWIGGPTV